MKSKALLPSKKHLACFLSCILLAGCTVEREPSEIPPTIRNALFYSTIKESKVEGVSAGAGVFAPRFDIYEASLRHLFVYFMYEQDIPLAHEYGLRLYIEREQQIRKLNMVPTAYGQDDLKKLLLICSLGDYRISGSSGARRKQQAELNERAGKNEPWAQTTLAVCYLDGIILHENREQAAWDLLQQAKASGDVLAQFYLVNWDLLAKKSGYRYRIRWHLNNVCYLYLPNGFGSPNELIVNLLSEKPYPFQFLIPSKLDKKDAQKMRSWCYPEGADN